VALLETDKDGDFSKSKSFTHHAEGLVNPKVRAQKKVTDFGYPDQKDDPKLISLGST
jgi:hypothetical protein